MQIAQRPKAICKTQQREKCVVRHEAQISRSRLPLCVCQWTKFTSPSPLLLYTIWFGLKVHSLWKEPLVTSQTAVVRGKNQSWVPTPCFASKHAAGPSTLVFLEGGCKQSANTSFSTISDSVWRLHCILAFLKKNLWKNQTTTMFQCVLGCCAEMRLVHFDVTCTGLLISR